MANNCPIVTVAACARRGTSEEGLAARSTAATRSAAARGQGMFVVASEATVIGAVRGMDPRPPAQLGAVV